MDSQGAVQKERKGKEHAHCSDISYIQMSQLPVMEKEASVKRGGQMEISPKFNPTPKRRSRVTL